MVVYSNSLSFKQQGVKISKRASVPPYPRHSGSCGSSRDFFSLAGSLKNGNDGTYGAYGIPEWPRNGAIPKSIGFQSLPDSTGVLRSLPIPQPEWN